MCRQDTAPHDRYGIKWRVWHHEASNISDGRPVARLKDRSLPHSCEGSHQLVPWIDLFSLNVLFSDQANPFVSHKLCIHIHADGRTRSRVGKVWSEGTNGEWDWRETHAPWACEAHVLTTQKSISPGIRTLQNRFWEKVRPFCSLRGVLTQNSDLYEI